MSPQLFCVVLEIHALGAFLQLCIIDAKLMHNRIGMQRAELKFSSMSAYDYQEIVLSIVKSFLQVCKFISYWAYHIAVEFKCYL